MSRKSLGWWRSLAVVVTCCIGFAPLAEADESQWQSLLTRRTSVLTHLRLAEGHARAGRCGAAIFHWREYLAKTPSRKLRARILKRIQACQRRLVGATPTSRRRPGGGFAVGLQLDLRGRVLVPRGVYLSGSTARERRAALALCRRLSRRAGACSPRLVADELAALAVTVKRFRIDRTEVTWAHYLQCVRAGRCARPPARFGPPRDQRRPVVGINWQEARGYCRWRGGRLPTDHEWEKAARGSAIPHRLWPWGRHAVAGCANLAPDTNGVHQAGTATARSGAPRRETAPVGGHPCDASVAGVLDLAGNVREWVRRSQGTRTRRSVTAAALHPVRGGSYRTPGIQGRVAARRLLSAATRAPDIGFRCAE